MHARPFLFFFHKKSLFLQKGWSAEWNQKALLSFAGPVQDDTQGVCVWGFPAELCALDICNYIVPSSGPSSYRARSVISAWCHLALCSPAHRRNQHFKKVDASLLWRLGEMRPSAPGAFSPAGSQGKRRGQGTGIGRGEPPCHHCCCPQLSLASHATSPHSPQLEWGRSNPGAPPASKSAREGGGGSEQVLPFLHCFSREPAMGSNSTGAGLGQGQWQQQRLVPPSFPLGCLMLAWETETSLDYTQERGTTPPQLHLPLAVSSSSSFLPTILGEEEWSCG